MQNQRSRRRANRRTAQPQQSAPPIYGLLAVILVLGAILGTAWAVKSLTGELLPALIVGLLVAGLLMTAWVRLSKRGVR